MSEKKLTEKVLQDGDIVEFEGFSEKYGCAEFVVCAKYERGKLKNLYLYPAQQENVKHFYRIEGYKGMLDWSIRAWTHKGMEEPRIWIHFWCKEHKAPAFRIYAGRTAKSFQVSKLSSLCINFDNGPRPKEKEPRE